MSDVGEFVGSAGPHVFREPDTGLTLAPVLLDDAEEVTRIGVGEQVLVVGACHVSVRLCPFHPGGCAGSKGVGPAWAAQRLQFDVEELSQVVLELPPSSSDEERIHGNSVGRGSIEPSHGCFAVFVQKVRGGLETAGPFVLNGLVDVIRNLRARRWLSLVDAAKTSEQTPHRRSQR